VALNAEWTIDSIDSISPTISKEWIALILLPTVGSLAGKKYDRCSITIADQEKKKECITATSASAKDRLSLSISVAVGSTIVRIPFISGYTISYVSSLANGFVCYSVRISIIPISSFNGVNVVITSGSWCF
jgi:Ca2+:H+ antiporter